MFLIKFSGNWADEMDVVGYEIHDDRKLYDAFVAYYKDRPGPFEVSVGSNEDVIWRDGNRMLSDFTIVELTNLEAQALERVLGRYFGKCPLEQLLDPLPDEAFE